MRGTRAISTVALWVVAAFAAFAPTTHAGLDESGAVSVHGYYSTELYIVGFPTGDNDVSVHLSEDRASFVASSTKGIEVGGDCVQLDDSTASCPRQAPSHVRAALRGGDDTLQLNGLGVRGIVFGAFGDDLLVGGPGGDRLQGQQGDDQLVGRAGPDQLRSLGGHDVVRGGAGDDRLLLADDSRTKEVSCGPGQDVAFVDEIDAEPRGCERVIRGE